MFSTLKITFCKFCLTKGYLFVTATDAASISTTVLAIKALTVTSLYSTDIDDHVTDLNGANILVII